MSVDREKDMIIQEKVKIFSFCLYIVDLGTIIGFSDKLNKTLKA